MFKSIKQKFFKINNNFALVLYNTESLNRMSFIQKYEQTSIYIVAAALLKSN